MSNHYYAPPPHQRYYPSPQQPAASSSSSRAAAAAAAPIMEPSFTPTMRDRQARGKEYYPPREGSDTSDIDLEPLHSAPHSAGMLGHLPMSGDDSFEQRRQKAYAIEVLDDPEKLAMYACSRGDSIAGTRLYFTRILCGMNTETPPHVQDYRKAKGSRQDNQRRSAGGDRLGRH